MMPLLKVNPQSELLILGLEESREIAPDIRAPQHQLSIAVTWVRGLSTKLIHSLSAESQRRLSAILGHESGGNQRLVRWREVLGLKPALHISADAMLPDPELRLSAMLGIEPEVDRIFLEEGLAVCGKDGIPTEKSDAAELSRAIEKRITEAEFARNLLIGFDQRPQKSTSKNVSFPNLKELAALGIRRLFAGGEYFRLDDSDPLSDAIIQPEDEKRLLDVLKRLPAKERSVFAVLHALSAETVSAASLEALLRAEHTKYPELSIRLQREDRKLGDEWISRSGFFCRKCGKNFPPLNEASLSSTKAVCRGLSRESWLSTAIGNLEELSPRLAGYSLPFVRAGLASLPLDRKTGDLSTGERELAAWSLAVVRGYQDLLLLGDAVGARLAESSVPAFRAAAQKLLENGNTILLAEDEESTLVRPPIPPKNKPAAGNAAPGFRVNGCNFTHGKLNLIIGPNSSGKTRLLRSVFETLNESKPGPRAKRRSSTAALFDAERVLMSRRRASSPAFLAHQLGIAEPLAKLYASLPAARRAGLPERRFRIDLKENCCPGCRGLGKIQQPDAPPEDWSLCESCFGLRFVDATLDVNFSGKTLADVLQLKIAEARLLFQNHEQIESVLGLLAELHGAALQLGSLAQFFSAADFLRSELSRFLAESRASQQIFLLDGCAEYFSADETASLIEVLLEICRRGGTVLLASRKTIAAAASAELVFLKIDAQLSLLSTAGIDEQIAKLLFF